MKRFIRSLTTPLGPLTVEMSEIGLRYIGTRKENIDVRWSDPYDNDDDDRLSAVKTYLADYFYGREPGRNDIPLDMTGISDFRKRVYSELMKVGFGEVVTYGELGKRAGYTGSAR
ncbi:MAG TPA: methylated-DNA--[protein]-cysteine S-methyltransferase, partial [Euryarchaeota archaeon]|nr:methylated-DNA--[protein]-cysteine S-methyltransferase [Euryarchaeota archaeon]